MINVLMSFILLLIVSAMCSLVEAAILSIPFTRVRILCEQGRMFAKDLLFIKENISFAISSIVVINNIVNISGSFLVGEMMTELFGDRWLGAISAVITFAIIFFGEIIPKTIGERFKIPISLFSAKPIRGVMFLLHPLNLLIMKITEKFLPRQHAYRVTEDEIKMMLKLGRDAGTVELDEEVLCNHVFKLNDLRARQIMKPITEVFSVSAQERLKDIKDVVLNASYSRIVVRAGDPQKIIGVVHRNVLLRELARNHDDILIHQLMVKPIYVAATTRADTLLSMFQRYHQHLFVVQDAAEVDAGIVTMEDVLEELFGEIYDEKDIETHAFRYVKR